MNHLNSLIIDNRSEARDRLKQAGKAIIRQGRYAHSHCLEDALKMCELASSFDVVFIASNFGYEAIEEFIKIAKEKNASRDSAFIILLQCTNHDVTTIAQNILSSADGILLEPYSADALKQVMETATRVKTERSEIREKIALKLLVTEILGQLENISIMRRRGYSSHLSFNLLHETSSVLKSLDPIARRNYYEILFDACINAPVPDKSRRSSSASHRVQRNLFAKTLEKIRGMQVACINW